MLEFTLAKTHDRLFLDPQAVVSVREGERRGRAGPQQVARLELVSGKHYTVLDPQRRVGPDVLAALRALAEG